jgi:F-type H+-transporting ATPase subunit b
MTITLRLRVLALAMFFGLAIPLSVQLHAQTISPEAVTSRAVEEEHDETDQYKHSAMVKKIGGMLGMSTETAATTFEFANFAVLALALGFALVKILPKTFRDRSSGIQKQLVDARTATEEASIRLNSVEERLSHLDAQIAEMKAQAERDSAADEARIKASVEEETKKILASADQEIAAASMHAQRQLQQYAAELAIEQAAKKLVISAETDRLLVQSFAQRLAGDDSKGGQN